MRARTKFDILLPVLHPVHDRYIGGNAEIAGNIEYPKLSTGLCKLRFDILNVGVAELAQVDLRPAKAIVPPDRVRVAFHEFEESLHDGFFARIARRATIGIRMEGGRPAVEEIQEARRKIFKAFVAQRPNR